MRGGKLPLSRKRRFGVRLLNLLGYRPACFQFGPGIDNLVEYETPLNFVLHKIRSSDGVGFDMKYVNKLFGVP
jgi:hypothetical protein